MKDAASTRRGTTAAAAPAGKRGNGAQGGARVCARLHSACGDVTSTTGSGLWGAVLSTSNWTTWCSGGLCSWLSPIYCFQQ